MAYQCLNASTQYFTIPALSISAPPLTLSIWINTASIIAKDTALFLWRGSVNTGVFLLYNNGNWELRYYVAGGAQWQTATGLYVSTGIWQHVCVAISSSQARLYLGGASFTNNVSHASANIDEAGDMARDPFVSPTHTSFNGLVAEAAIWTATLSDAECRAVGKRLSPLALRNRLHDLVFYKDLVRDLDRGVGPALTAVNAPAVVPHPPMIHPSGRPQTKFSPAHFVAPYRSTTAAAHTNPAVCGSAELSGAATGATLPIGEVTS
jgi:hypothetical protein